MTIFDAGEEHDLAYIAMEFLKGKDLADHCKGDQLLPVPVVLSIVARVAEALALDLSLQRAQLEHAIAILLGKAPSAFSLAPAPVPVVHPVLVSKLSLTGVAVSVRAV